MASPYALDFSPLNQGIDAAREFGLAKNRLAMEQERLGFDREMQPLKIAQAKTQVSSGQLENLSKRSQLAGGVAQALLAESDPTKKQAYLDRMVSSIPGMREDFDKMLPSGWDKNPDLVGHFAVQLAAGYKDPLKERMTRAQIAHVEQEEDRAKRLAAHQNELSIALAKAKSQIEVDEIMRKAQALGLDVAGPSASTSGQAAAVAPPAAPARPAITGSDPRFAAAATAPQPPQQQPAMPQRPNAPPARQAAPADPYLQLTQPAISAEQELAHRKARAAAAAVSGDIKGAGKIMAKDEEPKEYQTKDATFAERMARSEIGLRGILGKDNARYDPANYLRSWLPDWNLINSADWRNYVGSAREWIAAMLRKDTGAAVTETEWNLYFPTYFPQPGDDLAVQKLKMDRRIQSARGLRGSAGPAFDRMFPNFDQEMRQRLKDQDPKTYGDAKTNVGRLPPGNYVYNPSTGQVEQAP